MSTATIAATIIGLQGHPLAATAPVNNQLLSWNGTNWAPSGPYTALSGANLTGNIVTSGNIQSTGNYIRSPGNAGSFLNGSGINVESGKASFLAQYLTGGPWTVTSTSNIMAGFGSTITPQITGRVVYMFQAICSVSGPTNTAFNWQGMYGSGTPPAQGNGTSGAGMGINVQCTTTAANSYTFCGTAWSLTTGTTYWFDILAWVGASSTGLMSYANAYMIEV